MSALKSRYPHTAIIAYSAQSNGTIDCFDIDINKADKRLSKTTDPYQFKTKGEMMEDCKDFDYLSQSYVLTMSCSHPDLGRWKKERESNHCLYDKACSYSSCWYY